MLTIGGPLLLSVSPSLSKAFAVSSNSASSSNSLLLFNSMYLSTNLQVEIMGKKTKKEDLIEVHIKLAVK